MYEKSIARVLTRSHMFKVYDEHELVREVWSIDKFGLLILIRMRIIGKKFIIMVC